METKACITKEWKRLGFFEKNLTVWIILCIAGGILLGKIVPNIATSLNKMAIFVGETPIASTPIVTAVILILVKIYLKTPYWFGEGKI